MRWTLGPEVKIPLADSSGFYMHIGEDIRKCVVFFGYPDPHKPTGITLIGTGFLLVHDEEAYLVTVKHLSHQLGSDPFLLRINKKDGTAENLYADKVRWFEHHDPHVDVSLVPLALPATSAYDVVYLEGASLLLSSERMATEEIGVGNFTYTVGLFRLLSGEKRNLPICHFGVVSLLPGDERIPVVDWTDPARQRRIFVEGYLVESQSMGGLSGSPVFVRLEFNASFGKILKLKDDDKAQSPTATLARNQVRLLGIWQGAWEAPADEVRAAQSGTNVVPVGMGVVVPCGKLIELLERDDVKKQREEFKAKRASSAAVPQAVPMPKDTSADDASPEHRERFKHLLGAAVKSPKSSD